MQKKMEQDENHYSVQNQIGANLVERKSVQDMADLGVNNGEIGLKMFTGRY